MSVNEKTIYEIHLTNAGMIQHEVMAAYEEEEVEGQAEEH
jgi:hypothetical protein